MKRLGIFLIYDKENVIDKYIGYLLKELKTEVNYLVVVCNMLEICRGKEYIEAFADKIFYRNNRGYDAGGYKDALCNYIGWDKVLEYDELVLVNDSFFGPFVSMNTIFDSMNTKECDFWGLTKYGKHTNENGAILFSEHIQSFFLVIRKRMLEDNSFKEFWESMPYYTSLISTVRNFEVKFSTYFQEAGFKFDCLADMKLNDSYNTCNTFNQYEMIPYELMKKRNFPFLKKKALFQDTLDRQTQEKVRLALEYIDKETNYPLEIILEKIIREYDISELQRFLCLQYIISSDDISIEYNPMDKYKILVFALYESSYEYIEEQIKIVGGKDNFFICAKEKNVAKLYFQNGYTVFDMNNRGYIELWKEIQKYEYICILHDVDMSSDITPSYYGKSLFFHLWENLAKNKNYVSKIIQKFELDSRLGILTIPNANFGDFFANFAKGWGEYDELILESAEKYGIRNKIFLDKPPFATFKNFWIRSSILLKTKFTLEDLDVLSYLWAYIAQKEGYYSGIVESTEYAAMNEINMQYYLSNLCMTSRAVLGNFNQFRELEILIYCSKYKSVYIYGAGEEARKQSKYIPNIKAYVVSDGQPKKKVFNSYKILYLSEIEMDSETGMVICLNREHRNKVIPVLQQMGIVNYFLCKV